MAVVVDTLEGYNQVLDLKQDSRENSSVHREAHFLSCQ